MRRALRTTRHVSLGRPGQPIGALDSKGHQLKEIRQ
jgi:hypothetical protein